MAYVAVSDEFLEQMESKLTRGSHLVTTYRVRRQKMDEAKQAWVDAHAAFEEIRKQVEDHLLEVSGEISRVEQHKKGEAW